MYFCLGSFWLDLLPDLILSLLTFSYRRQKGANSMADGEQSCAAHNSSWLFKTHFVLSMSELFNVLLPQSVPMQKHFINNCSKWFKKNQIQVTEQ